MARTWRFILLVVGLWSAVLSATAATDPICQGKKLSQWFDEFSKAPASVMPATLALQNLGSNAVPYLVQFLGVAETNSWRKRAAMAALGNIGTNATAASPALIQCLNDADLKVQADAAYSLSRIGVKAAIPALRNYLAQHTDAYNGLAAAVALWRLDQRQASVAVTALTKMLIAEGHFDFDAHVISFLAEIGPPAHEAIPVLKIGLKEVSDADYQEIIREAMKRIQGKKTDRSDRG